MRQRNDTGYPKLVAADPPFDVADGETVEHPDAIAGLTVLEDEPADPPAPKRPRRGAQHDDHAAGDGADTPGDQQ